MQSILFVDDEPHVLNGLKRMLRGKRKKWSMTFVSDAKTALVTMEKQDFDIVVSDIRMPGMDGAQLLALVREKYPNMVRIILSGHTDENMVMSAVKPAHQYLAKPCDPEKLIEVLTRACTLSEFLEDKALVGLITHVDSLPTMPKQYGRLMDALDSDITSLTEIGEIVAQDIGMSATVLKLVNSAFWGLPTSISSPVRAVSFLGLDIVKGLAIGHQLFNAFQKGNIPGFSFEALWRHSLSCASIAKTIAQLEEKEKKEIDDACISGMLHDIGKLVLSYAVKDTFDEILQEVKKQDRLFVEIEKEILGTTHAQIGGYLLGLWGLDNAIVDAVAFHHENYHDWQGEWNLAFVIQVADILDRELFIINSNYARPELNLNPFSNPLKEKLNGWRKKCQNTIWNEVNA